MYHDDKKTEMFTERFITMSVFKRMLLRFQTNMSV